MNIPFLGAVLRSILDAGGYRIKNVGSPVEANDAVTKEYMESHGGAPSDYNKVRENANVGAVHAASSDPHVSATERSLWNSKQKALTDAQLANIADVPNKRDKTDISVYELKPSPDGPWVWESSDEELLTLLKEEDAKPVYDGSTSEPPWRIDGDRVGDWYVYRTEGAEDDLSVTFELENARTGEWASATATREATELKPTGDTLVKNADLDPKRDKTDNICAKDEYGPFAHTQLPDGVTLDADQPYWGGDEWIWIGQFGGDECNFYNYGEETEESSFVDFRSIDGRFSFTATRNVVAKATESYVTSTGVRNIVKTDDETRTAISLLAEASITNKAMPTEDAVEGSVSAKITALEGAVSGVETLLAAI